MLTGWSLRNEGQDMSLLASPRHFRSLVFVPFLAAIFAFPASAQTGSTSTPAENATILYALVKENGLENTQVVLTGVTPGGEFKVARGQANPWGFYEPDLALLLLFPITTDPSLLSMAVGLLAVVTIRPCSASRV